MQIKNILILSMLSFLTITSIAHAKITYRHIPFKITLASTDKLIVDYDTTGHFGIRCTSNNTNTLLDYVYKGNKKTASLPVVLQSARIPNKSEEELADVTGQFKLSLVNADSERDASIACTYIESN